MNDRPRRESCTVTVAYHATTAIANTAVTSAFRFIATQTMFEQPECHRLRPMQERDLVGFLSLRQACGAGVCNALHTPAMRCGWV
jgi:hypothetical protein